MAADAHTTFEAKHAYVAIESENRNMLPPKSSRRHLDKGTSRTSTLLVVSSQKLEQLTSST